VVLYLRFFLSCSLIQNVKDLYIMAKTALALA
jgi:hypothetical protein